MITGLTALIAFIVGTVFSALALKRIAARKNAASSQNPLKDLYRLLADNVMAAVVLRDAAGKIHYCSPYTEVITGYPVSTILASDGDFFASIVHEKDREHYTKSMKITSFGEPFTFRYRYYHKSGMEMWAETRTVPIGDEAGESLGSISITLDVTSSVNYQKQVEERNKDLKDFTYMITHDLKAPVYTIKGMLNVLEEDFTQSIPPEQKEILLHIQKAVKRLEELIGGVLEYSKVSAEAATPQAVELRGVMSDVLSDFSSRTKEAQAIIKISEQLPVVVGDRMHCYRIFSNLIGNALKYRDPSRPLEIIVEEHPAKTTRRVIIAIRDNGCGIPKDKVDVIFRPFQRAHPGNIEGTGIGLATVKKLLDKLGGDIEVQSEEGVGSTFFVTMRRG